MELSRKIGAVAGSLNSGADLEVVTGCVVNLIALVQRSNHPSGDEIAAILAGVIEHLDRKVISSSRALLALAARMAATSP